MTMAQQATGVREVKSAARTIDVLEFLAGRQGTQTRLRDVTEGLAAPRSSTYALLQTLVNCGWVAMDPSGTYYSIGIRALLAGTSYIDRDPRVRLVQPIIADVARNLGETIHLARLDGDQIVYLATAESHEYVRLVPRVGRRLPAAATSLGKAILSVNRAAVPDDMPPAYTAYTITDRKVLERELDEAAERGYALDDQESSLGQRCFGFPLRYDDPVIDSISCSVPLARLTPEHEQQIILTMRAAQVRIEESAPPLAA